MENGIRESSGICGIAIEKVSQQDISAVGVARVGGPAPPDGFCAVGGTNVLLAGGRGEDEIDAGDGGEA